MREIIKAKPIPNLHGWLLCEFENGEKRFIDIRPSMIGTLNKLKDPQLFRQVYVDDDAGTVAWPDDIHIDPDTLYNRGIQSGEIQRLANIINSDEHGDWLERA
ncbi:hypothetical protein GCM10008983_05870 [Lentibacillus halophilus]|uniref:DUF2442 domain-containing protein n=1 Tax=Lentibacillus halophilus TaxID=295065 RepID=A0ABN0Z3W2_9BACI